MVTTRTVTGLLPQSRNRLKLNKLKTPTVTTRTVTGLLPQPRNRLKLNKLKTPTVTTRTVMGLLPQPRNQCSEQTQTQQKCFVLNVGEYLVLIN